MRAMGSDRLRALLRDLADDDRKLLDCRFVDGWHYGDIAALLRVPHDVLADRVHRLRTDLRRKAKTLEGGRSGLQATQRVASPDPAMSAGFSEFDLRL
jgi:DNA-directed RNA polymerase specialized sigma24 family protein